jgi:hypothetical protein
MNKIIKGILIDTQNKQIKEVQIESEKFLEQCYELIGCQLVECISQFDGVHDLWVDEEGLFNETDFFVVEGYPQPIRGNGIIFGIDKEEFDSCSHTTSVEEVSEKVIFCNKESVLMSL